MSVDYLHLYGEKYLKYEDADSMSMRVPEIVFYRDSKFKTWTEEYRIPSQGQVPIKRAW